MRKTILTLIGTFVIVVAAFTGMYIWQSHRAAVLTQQQTSLTRDLQGLQSQYAVAQSTANISTESWKQYCDQFSPFCFKYPSQWTLVNSPLNFPGDNRDFVKITSPGKAVQINYSNPLIKDGGSFSARIIRVSHMTVNGTKLAVLGIIPVSSGIYQPSYMVLDGDQALNAVPSNDAILVYGSINPRFTVGKYDAISLDGSSLAKITSYAQAQAWFDSVDGKTVLKVIESYSSK